MSCVSFAERTNQFQVINYFQLYLRGVFRTLSKTSHLRCLTLFWIRLCLWYFCCKIYSSHFSYRFQGLSENCQKSLKVLIYQSSLRKKENLQTITQKSLNSLRNIKLTTRKFQNIFQFAAIGNLYHDLRNLNTTLDCLNIKMLDLNLQWITIFSFYKIIIHVFFFFFKVTFRLYGDYLRKIFILLLVSWLIYFLHFSR